MTTPLPFRVPLPGSERRWEPRPIVVGELDPTTRIDVVVVLRPDPARADDAAQLLDRLANAASPADAPRLTREELQAVRGATVADIRVAVAFARDSGLVVTRIDAARRILGVAGPLRAVAAAFGATLLRVRDGRHFYRAQVGGLTIPAHLDGIVRAVLGLDNRPPVQPHVRRMGLRSPLVDAGGFIGYHPRKVAHMYGAEATMVSDGAGQCIALIEMNDINSAGTPIGSGYSTTELANYFAAIGVPMPVITPISVDGGANLPGVNDIYDMEVMLDIEIAGATAPGAEIAVYFAPNTDPGWLDAIAAAINDVVHNPATISISWGGAELWWFPDVMDATAELMADAALLGITVLCSSGDSGSSGLTSTYRNGTVNAEFPGTCPWALSCGGTSITVVGGIITSEVVWNSHNGASAGGFSEQFVRPSWQSAGIPYAPGPTPRLRAAPDVAGNADFDTGYRVRWVDGTPDVAGGTSCVAPLFAAMVTLGNELLVGNGQPTAGFLNPLIYQLGARPFFLDIVTGNNDLEALGVYQAQRGWDACTGWGSPRIAAVYKAIS